MSQTIPCPVCGRESNTSRAAGWEGGYKPFTVLCPRCGSYEIDADTCGRLDAIRQHLTDPDPSVNELTGKLHLLSGYLRAYSDEVGHPFRTK